MNITNYRFLDMLCNWQNELELSKLLKMIMKCEMVALNFIE